MARRLREATGSLDVAGRASAVTFRRAVILLTENGAVLVEGGTALDECAATFDFSAGDPEAVIDGLTALNAGVATALRSLESAGTPFDLSVSCPGGSVRVSGRTSGALAMVAFWRESPSTTMLPAARTGSQVGARADLARQVEAQSLILNAAADAVAIFGPDRRLSYHNGAFAKLWGLEPAWLAEGPSHGAVLDRLRQDRRLPEAADYGLFKTQELSRHERLDPAPESIWRVGGERTLRVLSLPHPAGGLILMFSDITPEMRLNSQFNHLILVQKATLDKLTDAVAVFGPDGRLKLHNEAFQTFWSIPAPVLAATPSFDDIVDRCVARLHDMAFWRALKGRVTDLDPGVRGAARGEAMTSDGRWLAWQSRPLPDGATLVSFVDGTDTRRLEGALADREAALGAAEQLKHDFVGSVSYELRTPLTTILGYAELLEEADEGLSARARSWVASVREAAADLARSVEDILTFAQIDSGDLTLELSQTDVGALLAGAASRWRGQAEQGGVSLDLAIDDGECVILADPESLTRVVDHLIEHALKQTPSGGGVMLSARRAFGEVCLEVTDTGRGIPFHVQARIFDRFSGEEGAGAGLGLALVKALVELHGGWVTVESAPGAGAAFACHLPVAGQAEPDVARALA